MYVSPSGTPSGPGTLARPYDLATAVLGAAGKPGDTFWLRGGNYVIGHIDTRIAGAPGQPITFREVPGERARVDGSLTFFGSMGHVILRDFEFYSSDTNRVSSQTNAGFNVTDIKIIPGIASFSPNLSFINLIVRDQTRHGFYISEISTNNLVYGCIVYNNGWISADNAEGHGVYAQGLIGSKEISDCLVFNNSGVNMHIYENTANRWLMGILLEGNVAFNAGAIQNLRRYEDWVVGVDYPSRYADQIVLRNNMGYRRPGASAYSEVQIGRQGINGSVALLNNYFPLGLWMNNWTIAAVSGNFFGGQSTHHIVRLNQTEVDLAAAWDNNHYTRSGSARGFLGDSMEYNFSGWQQAMGFDEHSSYQDQGSSGATVIVRTNRYEPGRAHIVVYNWDNLVEATIDLSSVLAQDAAYEVRNAQDFFAAPVAGGIFDGQPLRLPMTGLSVASPNGPLLTAPPTGPEFNVFVLLPRKTRLTATVAEGETRVLWPTNSGNWVLEYTENLSSAGNWMVDTNTPVVDGGQYAVTNDLHQRRFYRLRAIP